jgi:hypothetical protein
MMAVDCDNHMKHINTLSGQNIGYLVWNLAVHIITTRLAGVYTCNHNCDSLHRQDTQANFVKRSLYNLDISVWGSISMFEAYKVRELQSNAPSHTAVRSCPCRGRDTSPHSELAAGPSSPSAAAGWLQHTKHNHVRKTVPLSYQGWLRDCTMWNFSYTCVRASFSLHYVCKCVLEKDGEDQLDRLYEKWRSVT